MLSVNIGTAEATDFIKTKLFEGLSPLEKEGLDLDIKESQAGSYNFVGCVLTRKPGKEDPVDDGVLFRHYLANAISDLVLDRYEKPLVRKIIDQNYYYFDPEEQDQIFALAAVNLEYGDSAEGDPFYRAGRKTRVLHRVLDYLEASNSLVMEGFIAFRLRDYLEELEEAVDHAVDNFMMDREYREFIRLLKYFVDIQEPRVNEVHVLISPSGSFKLKDNQNNVLQDECLDEFVLDLTETDINYDDLLISALITVVPSKIQLHGLVSERREAIDTIKSVFSGRVQICRGCPKCKEAVAGRIRTEKRLT